MKFLNIEHVKIYDLHSKCIEEYPIVIDNGNGLLSSLLLVSNELEQRKELNRSRKVPIPCTPRQKLLLQVYNLH